MSILFKNILSHIQLSCASSLVNWGLQKNKPYIVALGWRLAMRPSKKIKSKYFSRRKLVVLAKSGGIQDIEAAYIKNKADYAVLSLPRQIIKMSADFYLRKLVSDMIYTSDDYLLECNKKRYRKHLTMVLFWFKRIFGISAICQFNVIYYAERELSSACSECGIIFVAAHKECMWSYSNIEAQIEMYRKSLGTFNGDAISVYSSTFKNIFLKAQLLKDKQIYVVGCARLDFSHKSRINSTTLKHKTVLYYLIEPIAGPLILQGDNHNKFKGITLDDGSVVTWSEMIKSVNQAVMELAVKHPEINFICKEKTGQRNSQIQALINESTSSKIPKNIKFISGGVGHELIKKSSVVIGFNTTSVLEAIAAGVPTIVPNIFSKNEKKIMGYTHDVNEGALVPSNKNELKSMILEIVNKKTRHYKLTEGQKLTLDKLLGNNDGKSGTRLRNFLDRSVNGTLMK